ncbi:MAG: flavin monoamine oxidase family protein, partial [Thermoanaerobaculia bacterium]
IPPRLRRMSREFVSGYHAADPARISALSLAAGDEEIEGPGQNRQYRIVSGYGSLVTALRSAIGEACEIRLSTIARRIVWRKGHVVIHCRSTMGGDPVEIRARAVVLAIPAAVLKAGPEAPAGIAFDPPLRRLEDDLAQLEAGHVLKLVFAFRERFWDDLEWVRKRVRGEPRLPVHFLHFPGEAVPTWWTSAPARTALLTGWAGGPGAWELSAGGEAAAIDRALAILARGLRMPRRQLEGLLDRVHHHDWSADPFSLGAYTYVGVGGLPAQKRLSRPIEGTIFVAGEAASVEETGTVSGAIAAGKRAARAAMASTK